MADHPDWTDNNVIASQSQVLLQDLAPQAIPAVSVHDVSLFASLDIWIRTVGAIGDNPTGVKVIWSIGGQSVGEDTFTVWNTTTSEAVNGPFISMPVRGDSATVSIQPAVAGTTVSRLVVGSTRVVPGVSTSGGPGIDPGVQTGGLGILIGTGGNKNYYLGPLQGPFDFAFIAVTGAMVVTILAYYVNPAGAITVVLIKQTAVAPGAGLTYQAINLPNVAFSVGITNNSGAPGAYDVTISGGT